MANNDVLLRSLVNYVLDVKPYHTKLRDFTSELLFSDKGNVNATEALTITFDVLGYDIPPYDILGYDDSDVYTIILVGTVPITLHEVTLGFETTVLGEAGYDILGYDQTPYDPDVDEVFAPETTYVEQVAINQLVIKYQQGGVPTSVTVTQNGNPITPDNVSFINGQVSIFFNEQPVPPITVTLNFPT